MSGGYPGRIKKAWDAVKALQQSMAQAKLNAHDIERSVRMGELAELLTTVAHALREEHCLLERQQRAHLRGHRW
jgi:hypothetical protein